MGLFSDHIVIAPIIKVVEGDKVGIFMFEILTIFTSKYMFSRMLNLNMWSVFECAL